MVKLFSPVIAVLFALAATSGLAETRRTVPKSTQPAPSTRPADWNDARYHFRAEETSAIQQYYRAHPRPAPPDQGKKKKKKMPPGLIKKAERGGELPPGWQKKIARGEVMDPVVYRQSAPLPPELLRSLPPQPAGTVVVSVEGKIVRLVEATLTILDTFDLLR